MMKQIVLHTLFLTTCWSIAVTNTKMSTLNHTMQLLADLTQNYDKRLRPVFNQHRFLVVNMLFSLEMIRSFDDVSGEITLLGTFHMRWNEERFEWDPSDYGNVSEIILPKTDVWHPELFLTTSLNTVSHPGNSAIKAAITSEGNAFMKSTDLLTSICPVDVTNYPNDYQTCRLVITTRGYNLQQLRLGKSSSVTHNVSNNNEWDILGVDSFSEDGIFEVEIRLKRHSTYAMMTMTVPIHVLGILNPWVFFLPPDSGERTSYSITTFLAFTVYMGILTDNMPKGSLPVAKLMFQVFSMLIYSVVILFCTIVSLQIHTNEGKKPVPIYTQKVTHFFSFAFLRNRKSTVLNMEDTAPKEKNVPISVFEERRSVKRFSLRRYSSAYLNQASLPKLPERDDSETLAEEYPTKPAWYQAEMSWTQVGNVFDAYMLLFFGVWFVFITVYFSS